ncbi:MAG: hypothetical protein AMJ93_13260, partial [Anaerolineae bacterium SM23_84]
MNARHKLLRLLLVTTMLITANLSRWTGPTPVVRADEPPVPLPEDCGGSTGPACCIYGYIYYEDVPVLGVDVHIESAYGAVDVETENGEASSDPYYSADLSFAPLLVVPGDVITITASYSDMVSARTWTVQGDGQQVDLGLITGYQASGPVSVPAADAPDLATLPTPDRRAAMQGQTYLPDLPAAYHLSYNDLHAYNTIGRSLQAQVSITSMQRAVLITHHASRFMHRVDARGGVPSEAESITTDTADGARSVYAAVDDSAAAASCYARVTSTPGITYTTVQAAVDAAQDGDTVKVAGTCTGVEVRAGITQTVYIDKSIIVRGGYTTTNWMVSDPVANPTTLDAQGQGRVIYITGDINPTVEGLRITGGDADGLGGHNNQWWAYDAGGGMYIIYATAIISNNRVFSNTAGIGGGLFLRYGGGTTLNNNIVFSNTAVDGGGLGLGGSDATLNSNTVFSNTASNQGGGLRIEWFSNPTLSGNTVFSNTADRGGGLSVWWLSNPTLVGNTVTANTADHDGGGLFLEDGSDATLGGNTISSNAAGRNGGGLFLGRWLYRGSDAVLDNNFITDNSASSGHGSGLYVHSSSPQLQHNTVARNHGSGGEGLYVTSSEDPSQPQLHNTILVGHIVGITVTAGNTATLEATLWGTGTWANGTDWGGDGTVVTGTINVWGDPAFVNPDAGDYHIAPSSAAVDAGVYSLLNDDVDGQPRPMAFGPDIGADEYPAPGLRLNKRASLPLSQDVRNPGQTVTYTLVVTGVGAGPVDSVILTDALPPEQRVVASVTSTGDCVTDTTQVACTLGALNVGDSARITLTAQVTTTLPPTLPRRMRNSVWVTGNQASNFAYADVYLHDCHIRLNDDPDEWDDIQAAVDASTQPTDVVKVAGLCADINTRGDERQVLYLSKTVTIRGGYSYSPANWTTPDPVATPTTLHARGRGRVIYITGDINPTVEGLRITGGDAHGLGGYVHPIWGTYDCGGGVYIIHTTAIISNNWVFGNTAGRGGGLYLQWGNATLNGNTITANTAWGGGGGLFLWDSATLNGNAFTANTAYNGGGLYLLWSKGATLDSNIIAANTADHHGGGLYLEISDATLINNVVADNRANSASSGLHSAGSSPRLLHTTIAGNSGGDGSGLRATSGYWHPYWYYSSVALSNTILVSHAVGIAVTAGNTATLEATLWYDNGADWGGEGTINHTGNHDGNPVFVAPGAGDYHIGPGSAAINRGITTTVNTDIDGDSRTDGYPDIGADELQFA